MKVLFLMFSFPDMNKSFNMYTTLVEEFVKDGHEVTVVAPGSDWTGIYFENKIPILRVKSLPIKNVPNYLKGISNLLLPFQFGRAINKFYKGKSFDLIITPTPPITLVDLASKIKRKYKSKFYLILRDIFPQNAVDLVFIEEDGLLHKYFKRKEKKLYQEADFIGCMSQGNIDFVLKNNPEVSISKFHELKNFQKQYLGFGFNKEQLKIKYGLENKFVVVFGGNMGKPQQLENVLALADSVSSYREILFLLLGEGVEMNKLEKEINRIGLENIKIQRTIPKQEYQDLISVCNVGLISLNEKFTIPNIPSKALDYFNVGIPVLASLDSVTDFGKILEKEECGLWSLAGDILQLKNNLIKLYTSKDFTEQLGNNGKRYFIHNLLPENAYHTIMQAISEDVY